MASFGRAWRAFWKLSLAERCLLCRAWVLLPMTMAAIRVMGFRWTQRVLGSADQGPSGRRNLTQAMALARIVHGTANHHLFQTSCLVRSLVLSRLLRSQGLLATLRIGVAKPDGALAAHAWVEHAGVALAESGTPSDNYAPFDEGILTRGV